MARLTIENLTEDEKNKIKAACAAQGEYVSTVGRRLLLNYAGGEDAPLQLLDLCIEIADYLGGKDRTFEDNEYAMRLRAKVGMLRDTHQGEEDG